MYIIFGDPPMATASRPASMISSLLAPLVAAFCTCSEMHMSHCERMEQAIRMSDCDLLSMELPFFMAEVNP